MTIRRTPFRSNSCSSRVRDQLEDQTIHSSSTAGPRTQLRSGIMIESDRELSAMVQELWDNDVNRLTPGKDYRISLQVHHAHTHTEMTGFCVCMTECTL